MDEEFLATVKLITGEEIVAKVCYLEDEDKVLLENPLQVENANHHMLYILHLPNNMLDTSEC